MDDGTTTVYIADDHAMVREGLAALVARSPHIKVIGQCGEGLYVVDEVRQLRPDVVLLDITMPGLNGLDVCRELSRKVKKTAILMLTMHDDEEFIAQALAHGASGYILKESAADRLSEAIDTVAKGEVYLGPGIGRGVLRRVGRKGTDPYDRLTIRERQVLQMIAEGQTNRDVSKKLGLAVKTIDTHRARLMRKLGIHDQTTLVKFALRKGLVSLG
jgi:DNA-binding NarL/FixJ family response regulator